jgi:putative tricarboxylic transport membrane protein
MKWGAASLSHVQLMLCATVLATTGTAARAADAASWKPERNTAIVVGVAAGGALDITARIIQNIWQSQKLVAAPTVVINKPGAAGAIAWNMIAGRPGDGHLLAFATPTLLSNHILKQSDPGPRDFTPVSLLANDYIAFVVPAGSPIKTGKDLIERLKDNSRPFNIGNAAGAGNANHIALAKVAKAFGIDPKTLPMVIYGSGAISMTNLLGGHIDMAVTALYNAAPHHASGRLRIIGISSPTRFAGDVANVPTWREQGADVVHSFWRGVIAPKGLEPQKVAYWNAVFAATAATAQWKDTVAKNRWGAAYLDSSSFGAFLQQDYRDLQLLLNELGLVKP